MTRASLFFCQDLRLVGPYYPIDFFDEHIEGEWIDFSNQAGLDGFRNLQSLVSCPTLEVDFS